MTSPEQQPPAPRANPDLLGHDGAERTLLDAFYSGRLAHAWLIQGPKGIGKATLAYRFARFLLTRERPGEGGRGLFGGAPPSSDTLAVAPDHPVFRRVAGGGHADLVSVERGVDAKTGKRRSEIVVDDVRGIGSFLRLTPAEGGWRVVVVDAADEMNRNAANAVLKVLEEPPPRAVLLLVAHNPGRLLPTIRSRCRRLVLRPLGDDTVAALLARHHPATTAADARVLARLSGGSIGGALALADQGGLEFYRELLAILGTLPRLDAAALHALGDKLARAGAEDAFRTVTELLRWWLERLIRRGAAGAGHGAGLDGEAALMDRLLAAGGLDRWLEVWEKVTRLLARAESANLDRKQVVLNVFLALEAAARSP